VTVTFRFALIPKPGGAKYDAGISVWKFAFGFNLIPAIGGVFKISAVENSGAHVIFQFLVATSRRAQNCRAG
jgi:hypothetical protein